MDIAALPASGSLCGCQLAMRNRVQSRWQPQSYPPQSTCGLSWSMYQDRRVQQQLYFFACRLLVRFVSPSCRSSQTNSAALLRSSGWSASFQVGIPLSSKRNSFFRRTASWAVLWGNRISARLSFIGNTHYAPAQCVISLCARSSRPLLYRFE